MIKSFKKYENLSFDEINMDYLIGLPSGQIIDIHYTEINNLKQQGFVVFNKKLMSYVYNDDNHESILWYLKRNKDEEEDNPYSTYLSDEKLDEIQDFFDKQKLVDNYMLVQGGKIDVYGSVVVKNDKNGFFPIKFKRIYGDFVYVDSNLTSLKWGPEEVDGDFIIKNNNISDISNSPKRVAGNYDCSGNYIMSLIGAPNVIMKNFNCSDNFLVDLKGGPKEVMGTFDCSNNPLKTMEGKPKCRHIIGGLKKTIHLRDEGDGKFRW